MNILNAITSVKGANRVEPKGYFFWFATVVNRRQKCLELPKRRVIETRKRPFQDGTVAEPFPYFREGNPKLADVNPRTLSGIPVLGCCSDILSEPHANRN